MESKIQQISQNLELPTNDKFESALTETENLGKYGLLEFVKTVSNEETIIVRFVAELIASYNPHKREAKISGRTIKVDKDALGFALNLPITNLDVPDEDHMPPVDPNDRDYACFLLRFLSVMYSDPNTKIAVAEERYKMRECIVKGYPKYFYFLGFVWLLVESELLQGIDIKRCNYARYMQCLIRSQHNDLFVVDDGGGGSMPGQTGEGQVGAGGDHVGSESSKKRMVDIPKKKQLSKKRKRPCPKKKPSQGSLEHGAPEMSSEQPEMSSEQMVVGSFKRMKPRKRTMNPSESVCYGPVDCEYFNQTERVVEEGPSGEPNVEELENRITEEPPINDDPSVTKVIFYTSNIVLTRVEFHIKQMERLGDDRRNLKEAAKESKVKELHEN